MFVRDVLKEKGSDVISVEPERPMVDILRLFREKRIGFVVVGRPPDRILGAVSERDFCNAVAENGADAVTRPVADVMLRNVVTCSINDALARVSAIMTEQRARHVLVMDGEAIAGIVSIGDVVKYRLEEALRNATDLQNYIAGTGFR